MVKHGRGRPRSMVPLSPVNQPLPETPPVVETVKQTAEKSTSESKRARDEELETDEDERPKVNQPITETLITKEVQATRKLWVDVISENRNPAKGMSMAYIAPKLVNGKVEIEIEREDIKTEIQFLENALILYVMGENLSMNTVKNYMMKFWNFVQTPDFYYNEDGYFLARFKTFEEREAVMMKGSYTIKNMPMILKEWYLDFNLKRDLMRTIPIWIKLPQLPLHLWGVKSLNKIGSALGTPLVTDECTASKLCVSYARILVEVDITQPMLQEISIKDVEGRIIQH
ncbi:uncharacterized protein LOC131597787 [Vicia villosa]|uniref:uncharacterized protein LOC131597787 n=1 Tax=Vicia villosa TaxID=3911 RepID=UPI00273BF6EE|nr:uncharacterized protein LOC131597787 [Vicia villosa]